MAELQSMGDFKSGVLNTQSGVSQFSNLPYNLQDNNDRQTLTSLIQKWITDADSVHRQYWPEWDEVDDRLNSARIPVGFTTKHAEQLAAVNNPKLQSRKTRTMRSFVTVNRTRPNHESTIGEFISIRRKLMLNATNPTDRNRARVMQKRIEYIERTEMLPDEIYFPAMDGAWAKGLHWIGVTYNPFARGMRGRFDVTEINVRDILLDPGTRGHFMQEKEYLIHRYKMPIEEARVHMRRYPLFDATSLGADNEYDEPYQRRDNMPRSEYATFYHVEFFRKEPTYYAADPNTGGIQRIGRGLYDVLNADPRMAGVVFEGEQEENYYVALYNSDQGVFHLQKNVFDAWTRIPLVNMATDSRVYPLGDVQVYASLADLLDTVVTVFLQNAKRTNKPIADVDEEMFEEYQSYIDEVLESGGAAPGIKNIFNVQPINSHLVMLIPWIMGWIQDTVSRHSASQGQLPAKQIAKETVELMIQRDRVAHGRKDVTLRWMLTQLARILARGITIFDKDPDFFQLTDTGPGEIDYVPVNQVWTEAEYITQLALMAGLHVPEPPQLDRLPQQVHNLATTQYGQESIAFEEAMYNIRRRFEQDNDVKSVPQEGYIIEGREYTDDDVVSMLEESGLSWEEFNATYQVQRGNIQVYLVNPFDEDLEYNIEYTVDTDFQNDPEFKTNQALLLNARGAMGKLDMLKQMNVPDADGIHRRALEENEAIQMAMAIAEHPELRDQFLALIQGTASAAAGKNGKTKKPATAQ